VAALGAVFLKAGQVVAALVAVSIYVGGAMQTIRQESGRTVFLWLTLGWMGAAIAGAIAGGPLILLGWLLRRRAAVRSPGQ
jgi:hypothetical protein